jgi:hypothetical protein
MVSTSLIITKILMILPSVVLGFLLYSIGKTTGVLSPEKRYIPTRWARTLFTSYWNTIARRREFLQRIKPAECKNKLKANSTFENFVPPTSARQDFPAPRPDQTLLSQVILYFPLFM